MKFCNCRRILDIYSQGLLINQTAVVPGIRKLLTELKYEYSKVKWNSINNWPALVHNTRDIWRQTDSDGKAMNK